MRNPDLRSVFPPYFDISPSLNSFPSLSTTLYGSVAAGIYALNKQVGTLLWLAVVFAVALPRMYVGGHYLSDVLVGAALAWVGHAGARLFLTKWLRPRAESLVAGKGPGRLAWEVLMFVWILQVAIEFRDAIWVKRMILFVLE
jgi:membrane-associated phospholipid phosphatase